MSSRNRFVPFVGPALVLYLGLEIRATGPTFDAVSFVIWGLALLLSYLPARRAQAWAIPDTFRMSLLGIGGGLFATTLISPFARSLSAEWTPAITLPAMGILFAVFTRRVPTHFRRPGRGVWFGLIGVLGACSTVLGVVAGGPAFQFMGQVWVLSSKLIWAPHGFAVFAAIASLFTHVMSIRRARSSKELSSGLWAIGGLGWALAVILLCVLLATFGSVSPRSAVIRVALASAVAGAVMGYLELLHPAFKTDAGWFMRRSTGLVLVAIAVGCASALLSDRSAEAQILFGMATAAFVVLAFVSYGELRPVLDRLFAPAKGALLRATKQALLGLERATTLEEVAEAVLVPMRTAALSIDAEPRLFTFTPSREIRIDAAGIARVEKRELADSLRQHVLAEPNQWLLRAFLEEAAVRRMELRSIAHTLVELDALCAIPLTSTDGIEGLLVIPRGRRRTGLTLEEEHLLDRLRVSLSSHLAVVLKCVRADTRTNEVLQQLERETHRAFVLERDLARDRENQKVLRASVQQDADPSLFAYSSAMKRLLAKLQDASPLDAPVLLVMQDGTDSEPFARRIHEESTYASGPFVVADCSNLTGHEAASALFGERTGSLEKRGLLDFALGGTLVLLNVPALPTSVQKQLAEAFASRQFFRVGSNTVEAMDCRVVATTAISPIELSIPDHASVELFDRLSALCFFVPPLRERVEDLGSIVLLLLSQTCRALARNSIGLEPQAMEWISRQEWPGSVSELRQVVHRSVKRARGPVVSLEDVLASSVTRGEIETIPSTNPSEGTHRPSVSSVFSRVEVRTQPTEDDPLSGTYEVLERRILQHALERANGNKSEAARLLALKRTTFLDKLRRYKLDGETSEPQENDDAA